MGDATLAASEATACSMSPPGRMYCVMPRARSVSRSSRYVLTSYPIPNAKTRNGPRPCSA